MRMLNKDEIKRNFVETINQYKVLQYLKQELNTYEFDLFLYDKDTIKIIDKDNRFAYFKYKKETNDILFLEELEDNNREFEL